MKKLIFVYVVIIICSFLFIKNVEAKNSYCYTSGTTLICIDSVVISATDCSVHTEANVLCRDTDDDIVYIGNGTSAVAIGGVEVAGDVTSIGDCLSGACLDGSSDGGTYIRLYDGDSNYTAIVSSNLSSNVTTTLPATTGTLAILGGNVWTGVHDFGGATSVEIPNGSPTVDAAGEIGIDTTTDQLIYYGTAKQVISPKMFFSVVVPSVADTDDMLIMKAPYGMTLASLDCVVSAATSATINIQECSSTGGSCVDMATSDLVCDTDGASTTTFGGSGGAVVDSGDWIKLDIPSISGTPGTLTVTVTYTIVAD